MPRVSRWLVRSSLLCLAAGATLGACLLVGKAVGRPVWSGSLLAVHRELVVVGWLVQLALGVGLWILPPVRGQAVRERRGWTIAGALSAGIVLYLLSALWTGATGGGPAPAAARLVGRGLEAAAVLGFGVPLLRRPWR